MGPGAAWGAEGDLRTAGWASGAVRFEPLANGSVGLTVAGTGTYRGAIEVRRNGRALAVRNDLTLEEYVRGIEEVPPSWPAAALQAQAIAARTYAAHKVVTGDARWRAVGADICATPTCQVYAGLDAERRAAGHGWLPAVEATKGRALLAGGRPIMASYNSTADGPQAMSQNGALAMATEGRSSGDILETYYGIRPTAAGNRLPATIRVALEMSAGRVRVSSAAGFRVVDGAGVELAVGAPGEWTVEPGRFGLRLVPPDSYHPPVPPTEVTETPPPVVVVRRAGRVITASATSPAPTPWAPVAALASVVATATATLSVGRRRRSWASLAGAGLGR